MIINLLKYFVVNGSNQKKNLRLKRIMLFFISVLSLVKQGKDGLYKFYIDKTSKDREEISFFQLYNNEILLKITNSKKYIKEVVHPNNFPKSSLYDRREDIHFVSDLVNSVTDLISKNLVLLSPLKTIYRFVFNTARVIMRINDVQCSKGQKYKRKKT